MSDQPATATPAEIAQSLVVLAEAARTLPVMAQVRTQAQSLVKTVAEVVAAYQRDSGANAMGFDQGGGYYVYYEVRNGVLYQHGEPMINTENVHRWRSFIQDLPRMVERITSDPELQLAREVLADVERLSGGLAT